MKRKLFYTVALLVFFNCLHQQLAAQVYVQPDCYKTYKSRGDAYKAKGYFDLAVQQYKNAKNCSRLRVDQIRELDMLIADANRRISKTKVITKRY